MLASRAFLTVRVTLVLRSGEIAVRSPGGDRGSPSQREPDPARDHLDGRLVTRSGRSARGCRPPALRRERRSRLLRLPRSTRAASGSILRAASRPVRPARRPDRARARRRARLVGGSSSGSPRSSARTRSPTPRVKYVPELEEERFQSLVAVPILGKDGDPIGVISLHTEAPREFTDDEVEFLVSSASLVAGAIENARLYEESRRRVGELEHLTGARRGDRRRGDARRSPARSRVAVARASRARTRCRLYLLDPSSERAPASCFGARRCRGAARRSRSTELGPELSRGGRAARVAVPLVASDELLGPARRQGRASSTWPGPSRTRPRSRSRRSS